MESISPTRSHFNLEKATVSNQISLDPPDSLPRRREEEGSPPSHIATLKALTGYPFPETPIDKANLELALKNPKKMPLDSAICLFLAAPFNSL
jgi:hypothetical protein